MLPSGWAHAVHRSALSWTGASGGGRASRLLWCRMRLRPRAGGCSVPVAVHRASSRTGTTPCLALRMKGAERRRFSRRSAVEGWQPSGLPCVPARIASTRCLMRAGFMRRTPSRLNGLHTAGRVRGIRPVRASPARACKREASPSSPIAALPPWPSTASGAMLARQHPSKTLRVTPAWTTEGEKRDGGLRALPAAARRLTSLRHSGHVRQGRRQPERRSGRAFQHPLLAKAPASSLAVDWTGLHR
jgi:hypothetical protein